MNWREIDWNIVTLGRVIGVVIIAVGILLSALDASALNTGIYNTLGSHYKLRFFLHGVIEYLWRGGLVIIAAEIANRVWWRQEEEQELTDDGIPTAP